MAKPVILNHINLFIHNNLLWQIVYVISSFIAVLELLGGQFEPPYHILILY